MGPAWRRAGFAGAWLAVVAGGGWLVHHSEVQQRDNIDQQMWARTDSSAQFIAAYAQDVLERNLSFAEATLQGDVTDEAFGELMAAGGFEAALVLDRGGSALAVFPSDPDLLGEDLATQYAHLHDALAGRPSVSGVVLSAVRQVPVVAFAVPYDSPPGRRVFSSAYAVSSTPLQSYLANEAGNDGGAFYLLDSAGKVVVSTEGGSEAPGGLTAADALADVDPALASALGRSGVWQVDDGDTRLGGATVAVAGTPWRVMYAAPAGSLYAPASEGGFWTARLAFLALALASLAAIALAERTFTQRSRLLEQQTASRAVIDSANDAFVGTDHQGVVVDWNPAAAELFGWSRQEAIGRPAAELVLAERHRTAETGSPGVQPFAPGGEAPRGGSVRLTGCTRSGLEIPLEVSVSVTGSGAGARFHAFIRDDRPRRAAEQQMRISAQVAEFAGDATYSRDLDGRLTSWNRAAGRMFGWNADDMLGTGLDHPLLGAQGAQIAGVNRQVASSQVVRRIETRLHPRDGREVAVALTVAPVVDAVGVTVGVSVSARDISQRLELEDALRHSEAVFRSAFDDALLGMFLTGLDGRLTRVNQVFAQLLGRSDDELLGRSYDDLTHPDFRGRHGAHVAAALAEERDGFRDEMCYLAADGSPVWADTSTAVIRNRTGQPLHFVTQVVDTTLRRALAEERAAREAMLAAVISNSQSLIYVKDLDGRYLLMNSAFERAFGVTESELLGKTDQYLDPDLAPVWRVNDVKARDGAYQLEEWSEGPDGRMYYDSVKFPLFDAAGRLYATCGVSLEVTERRRAALALALARDEAVAATMAKSAFLATMSHEIRTPMNAVIGLTGLLLDTDLDRQQREFVETVRQSGDALLAVINDILDFSKIEAGQLTLEQRVFDLTELAEGAIDLMAVSAVDKGLDLLCYLEPQCPTQVLGDPTRLRQVLVNLLSNAIKFTDVGSVLLRVSTSDASPGEHHLRFAVVDTGIGIPSDGMDRLFQSFSQVDDTTTRVYGGTGLGLAISRRLTEAMGGDLSATSTEGAGSTFVCSVVVGAVATAEGAAAAPGLERTDGASVTVAGKKVLVVDDDPTCRQVLALQLGRWDLDSVTVETAREALDLLADGSAYDLALLDRDLPDMDGVELGERLRITPGGNQLPLVLLTALGGHRPDVQPPFTALLSKPVKIAALREVVVAALTPHLAVRRPREPEPDEVAGTERRLRVLLVEDNTVNQRVAQLMVRKLGHFVDTVGNGKEGVDAALSLPYDVVLMDVQMPVMDGLEATRRIRAVLPPASQPYIVAMTASVLLEDRDACRIAGMDSHLAKPVRERELRAAMAAAVR